MNTSTPFPNWSHFDACELWRGMSDYQLWHRPKTGVPLGCMHSSMVLWSRLTRKTPKKHAVAAAHSMTISGSAPWRYQMAHTSQRWMGVTGRRCCTLVWSCFTQAVCTPACTNQSLGRLECSRGSGIKFPYNLGISNTRQISSISGRCQALTRQCCNK